MKKHIPLLIVIFLAITSITRYEFRGFTDVWWHRWFFLCIFCTLIATYKVYKEYSLVPSLIFFHTVFSGLLIFSNYNNIHQGLPHMHKIKFFSAYGTFTFVILSIAFMNLKPYLHIIKRTFIVIMLVNIGYVLYRILSGQYPIGLWGEPSINGSLIACILPLALYEMRHMKIFCMWLIAITVLTLASTKASVPVGALAVSLLSYLFLSLKNKKLKILIPLGVILVLFFVASKKDKRLFDNSKRFTMYKLVYNIFNADFNKHKRYFGWGTGVTQPINKMIQEKNNFRPKAIQMWTHNDWLQILFENGFIGFILALWLSLLLLWTCYRRKNYALLSSSLTYMASMVFSYHLHYPIHAFFGFYLVAEVFKNDN